ncbi:MAG TPA: hypothetical protein VFS15_16055 [Kofleriaceae bacterium]|nr:hypothetical protein [Kofleriaceae bacterium]
MHSRLITLALVAPLATGACKDKQDSAQVPAARTPSTASRGTTPRPSLPTPSPADEAPAPAAAKAQEPDKPAGPPMEVADAQALLPAIEGTQVIALKQTSDHQQVHGTWCVDGASADDVARKVAGWLGQAGYTAISTRGDERKAGVMGDKDGFRFSMVVSASSAAVCKAPAHYFASATVYRL